MRRSAKNGYAIADRAIDRDAPPPFRVLTTVITG